MTVVFSFLTDDDDEVLLRDALDREVERIGLVHGCGVEVHHENMLADHDD